MISQYRWYMAGVASFVIPMGIQTILFPWLIVVELQQGPERLGIAQMSTQIPGLLLILLGGLLADRVDRRSILIWMHVLAGVPSAALAFAIWTGSLSYSLMIAYALFIGTVGAFVQPARDGMLNQIADGQLQRTVTITMGLTFGAQIFGFIAASFADQIGAPPLLLAHSAIMLVGAFFASRLHRKQTVAYSGGASGLQQIKEGVAIVLASTTMRPSLILIITMSFFYGGSFMVINPLVVRDVYFGSAAEIAMSFACFMLGTIGSTVILVSVGGIKRKGLGLMLALFLGGFGWLIASFDLPFTGYLAMLFLWGMGGGVAMSMSRTIMQESAPEAYRARVLSLFSLGNLGGMPLGALFLGFVAGAYGPLLAIRVAVGGVWLMVLLVWIFTNLNQVGKADEVAEGSP